MNISSINKFLKTYVPVVKKIIFLFFIMILWTLGALIIIWTIGAVSHFFNFESSSKYIDRPCILHSLEPDNCE